MKFPVSGPRGPAGSGTGSRTPSSALPASGAGAVGAEVPVVVHASRYSASARPGGKLPPVHEETRTVIVFPEGAVVRLSALLLPGETAVLINVDSGAEVICRVTKVKQQPGLQSYVELEFSQRAPGFWGDLFSWELNSEPASRQPNRCPEDPAAAAEAPGEAKSSAVETPSISLPAPEPEAVPSGSAESVPPLLANTPVLVPATSQSEPPGDAIRLPSPRQTRLPAEPGAPARTAPDRSTPSLQLHLPVGQEFGSKRPVMTVAGVAVLIVVLAGGWLLLRPDAGDFYASSAFETAPPAMQEALEPEAPGVPDRVPFDTTGESLAIAPSPEPEDIQPVRVESPEPPAPAAQPVRALRPVEVNLGEMSRPTLRSTPQTRAVEPPPVIGPTSGVSPLGAALEGTIAETEDPARPAGGQLMRPRLVSSSPPAYPPVARSQRIEGTVVIDALVDKTGAIAEMNVLSGPAILRSAAMDALRTWEYQPAQLNGEPVAVHTEVSIRFELN